MSETLLGHIPEGEERGGKPKPDLTKMTAAGFLLHRTNKRSGDHKMIGSISSFLDRVSMTVGAAALLAALPVAAYATVTQAFAG
ncbi:MAG TPA: hypothetical protein VF699_00850 [Caulobacteraceae bacterium]